MEDVCPSQLLTPGQEKAAHLGSDGNFDLLCKGFLLYNGSASFCSSGYLVGRQAIISNQGIQVWPMCCG